MPPRKNVMVGIARRKACFYCLWRFFFNDGMCFCQNFRKKLSDKSCSPQAMQKWRRQLCIVGAGPAGLQLLGLIQSKLVDLFWAASIWKGSIRKCAKIPRYFRCGITISTFWWTKMPSSQAGALPFQGPIAPAGFCALETISWEKLWFVLPPPHFPVVCRMLFWSISWFKNDLKKWVEHVLGHTE